jgi:bisphosphoglycerate-independent phosphoglycerate mutase (AlkP superfamily)
MSKILCILDGFGLLPKSPNNASALAKMPNFKYLLKNYYWTTLNADGEKVGQEDGLVGNSEVGHMNIGGLKLVPQLSYQVTKSAASGYDLDKNVTPDQLFDPKKFLEKKWNEVTMSEIAKFDNLAAGYIYKAYNICVDSGCLNAGEVINSDPEKFTINDFFEFIETWWTYTDPSRLVIKDMVKVFEKDHDDKKSEVFNLIDQAYEATGVKFSTEIFNYFNNIKNSKRTIHLIGLFSTGTIHSDLRHWAGSIEAAGKAGAEKIVMHLISDGRDSDRQSLVATWDYFIKEYESKIKDFQDKIFLGSLGGRFYAMDRDNNWDRVARGILPMFSWKTFKLKHDNDFTRFKEDKITQFGSEMAEKMLHDNIDSGDFNLLKEFILSKYDVDLNKILDLEKEKFEKDNVDFEPTEENFQKSNNFYVHDEEHFFFLNADNQEREEFGPLSVDIRWIIEWYSEKWYKKEVYDEFILPCNFYYLPLNAKTRPFEGISKNDTVWLLNFRTDRMKEFAQVLTDINEEFELNLTILANNSYGIKKEEFLNENLEISEPHLPGHFGEETYKAPAYFPIFRNRPVENTLAQYISENSRTQLHIAETEKYNHVTYFMNGGQNKKWEGEDWQVVDSNKVASHAEKPEMKAKEVTDYILESGLGKYDYILVNYANPDMVGHTGDIKAAITTMEFLDTQLGRLIEACEKDGHEMVITADHGNIEKVGDYDFGGKSLIDTEHNANSVPLIVLSSKFKVQSAEIGENKVVEVTTVSPFVGNVQKLIENKVVKLDLRQFENVLSQNNQVDLGVDSWLTQEQIPEPVLPLWYVGLILIGL